MVWITVLCPWLLLLYIRLLLIANVVDFLKRSRYGVVRNYFVFWAYLNNKVPPCPSVRLNTPSSIYCSCLMLLINVHNDTDNKQESEHI